MNGLNFKLLWFTEHAQKVYCVVKKGKHGSQEQVVLCMLFKCLRVLSLSVLSMLKEYSTFLCDNHLIVM